MRHVSELLTVIPEAFRIAMSGRPGPVLVDIPKDVQTALIDVENLPEPAVRAGLPAIDLAAVQGRSADDR